jgi:hypothetical protein
MFFKSAYHHSIDSCPIGVFQDILKRGDLQKLVIKGKPRPAKLNEAWELIYDEYLKLYGIPQSFKDYCNKKIQAGEMFAESLIEGQSWKRAIYEMLNEEAESAISSQQSEEFEKVLAYTSKKVGFRIDPKAMTVREFYGYLNLAEDNGK